MTPATHALEETIRNEMQRNRIPGAAIALIRGDEVVFAEGYGLAAADGGKPVTPETRFAIMSVTKTIVVSAMMQLRDAGHFHLDDPANKHLAPASTITNQWEAESPVTIRQLMTHSGGLPVAVAAGAAQKLSLAEHVKAFARTTHRPGAEIIYANTAFDAMGVMIENWSAKRVDDYLQDHIFQPLCMTSTVLANPADGEPHATGHYLSAVDGALHPLPLPEWPTIPASPAGGCWSSVLDVARFVIAHLNGGASILDADTVAEMHDLHFRQSEGNGQGLGFRVTCANGRKLICHGGDGAGFTAFAAIHPEERVGVVLLQNADGMQTARSVIGNTALQALTGEGRRSFASAQPIPAGTYKSTFWDISIECSPRGLVATEGLVLLGETDETTLQETPSGSLEASGGLLHGFEVTCEGDRFFGGVYPFTFVRAGDLVQPQPIDETADLAGSWRGTTHTPMGPLAISVKVTSETTGNIDTPFQQEMQLAECAATRGRLSGQFSMQVPGVGQTQMFLRLECRGGRLAGRTYARTEFGEFAMQTALERA